MSSTKIAILDAARDLFETHGYFAVGLEAVAKKAGVSRQAIYLHFASRAELLRALHERVFEQDVEPINAKVWQAATATEALDAFVEASARAAPRIAAIFNALDAARRVDPDAQATWEAPMRGRQADCLRMAEWLKRDGQLAPGVKVGEAADILWSLLSIRAYETLVMDRDWSPARWSRWVRQTLRQLLCAS